MQGLTNGMQITFGCIQCGEAIHQAVGADTTELQCPGCQTRFQTIKEGIESTELKRCIVCPSVELFLRKDFPQRLGVTIVVLGMSASCVTWFNHWVIPTFAILFATAILDLLLYISVGEVLECYRCHAQYRGASNTQRHAGFDLELHEKHRQQKARLANPQ